ncbi:DUF4194 domain-containing protein [Sulfuriroseicoccus oceanibius]|uniref:DUF4194 domain-containing protein n=1 Tax=Sulfuriroseicoccus oceanibius TaxID=2707525 RepID=A0A6B3L7K1_9BACT|nr:DUF4194 domain-containing protein [Sulfuriroseicoccus oceanibius]QQL44461.1 DUF4194 domain-containing protein [Sulfuriroseicoccus oceanibius]
MNEIPTPQDEASQQSAGLFTPNLQPRDKQMLQDVAHRLLAHGSLLRARGSEKALYDWAMEHMGWLEDWAEVIGLKIIVQRDDRLIMAVPEVPSLTRRLRRDETLVALALWYDYDVEVRENGAHDVFLTVRDFNEQFCSKFPSMQPLSASRLREILRGFAKFNLIETDWTDDFSDSVIQVLPTLRFAIPFPDIEEWLKAASAFNTEAENPAGDAAEESPATEDAPSSDETEDSEA